VRGVLRIEIAYNGNAGASHGAAHRASTAHCGATAIFDVDRADIRLW